ncbi:cathepsin S [Amia ocellicauda]|uniref:cathepsin S n=1 Tax=Amia ocellicauda TaxID=2972642 RepID=UPI0034642FA2
MQAALTLLLVCGVAVSSAQPGDPSLDSAWEDWKTLHGKQYTEEDSEGYRRQVWEENLRFIEQHNLEHSQGKHSYTLGMNHFGDLTQQEVTEMMTGFSPDDALEDTPVSNWTGSSQCPPRELDWRNKGYVTGVKNQGSCGSCWAFSATGALEGQYFKKTGKLVSLSEQNLVDCTKNVKYGNHGCKGGYMCRAFDFVRDNKGIALNKSYPYTAKDNKRCKTKIGKKATTCKGYKMVPRGNERALRDALVAIGPISVALDASRRTFHYYRSGIYFDRKCSKSSNHAVLAVGYGISFTHSGNKRPNKYWILKNSWGHNWGDNGYIQLAREYGNHCGIAQYAVYPLL